MVPGEILVAKKTVKQVTVPGKEGVFGILENHVPTVAELRPGVVSVEHVDGSLAKYFVSGGFAFMHPGSVADISAAEAVKVEDLDPEKVKAVIADAERRLSGASDDIARAEAEIYSEVGREMQAALDGRV
jgi:F-type H+-transporting ATPase subunit delta